MAYHPATNLPRPSVDPDSPASVATLLLKNHRGSPAKHLECAHGSRQSLTPVRRSAVAITPAASAPRSIATLAENGAFALRIRSAVPHRSLAATQTCR